MALTTKSAAKISFLVTFAVLVPLAVAHTFGPPRIIPHSAPVNKPLPEVFKTLKSYFSDRLESKFELVSSDEKTSTIVAKQTGIDSARWKTWAACETDPMHMIYQLNDARVTVTIGLDKSPHNTTFMTVSADFQGVYGLAQDQTTIECKSTGALEEDLLAFAGAQTPGAQGATTSTAPAH